MTDYPMTLVSDHDYHRKYIAYIPEYDNTSDGTSLARIKIEYNNELASTDYIDFKYYNATGTHPANEKFDIARNNWYKFNVSKFLETSTPDVEVDVIPYATRDLEPTMGLDPTYEIPDELYVVGDLGGKPFSPDRGVKLSYDAATKIFEGEVEITGKFWFATGLNTELEPDRFYSHGNQFGPRIATKISYYNTVFITQLDSPQKIDLTDNTPYAYYKIKVDWNNMEVHLEEASPAEQENE